MSSDALPTDASLQALRERAREILAAADAAPTPASLQDALALVHELRVHEIELALQNESLVDAQRREAWVRAEMETLFEATPVGLALIDPEARILRANSRLLHWMQRPVPPERLLTELRPEAELLRVLSIVAEDGIEQTARLHLRSPSGTARPVTLIATPSGTPDVNQVLCVLLDETEREATARAVRESEARYRTLFELLPELALVVRAGVVLAANRHAAQRLRVDTPKVLQGVPVESWLGSSERATWRHNDTVDQREPPDGAIVEVVPTTGSPFFAEVTSSWIPYEGDEARLLVLHDISEREERETRLRLFESVFVHAHESVVIIRMPSGTHAMMQVAFANRAAEESLGYTVEELTRMPLATLLAEENPVDIIERLAGEMVNGAGTSVELRFRHRRGHIRWYAVTLSPIRTDEGALTHVLVLSREITEQKLDEAFEAARAECLQAIAADQPLEDVFGRVVAMVESRVAATAVSLVWRDAPGTHVLVSPGAPETLAERLERVAEDGLAVERDRLVELGPHDTLPRMTRHDPIARAYLEAGLGWPGVLSFEAAHGAARGVLAWTLPAGVSLTASHAAAIRTSLQIAQVGADRRQLQQELTHRARFDALTSLLNRYAFEEELDRAIREAQATEAEVALLFIDLDRFKQVNDTLGHAIGDRLLVEVADRLRRTVRESDVLARTGGDEFVVVSGPVRSALHAGPLADRIGEAMQRPFLIEGHTLYVSASIGISVYPTHGASGAILLQRADAAMYTAKARGRAGFASFEASGTDDGLTDLALEAALRESLASCQLEVHYQPQVRLPGGVPIGVEALARWTLPDGQRIPPDRFIPIAEESGLILPLGEYVLAHACREFLLHEATTSRAMRLSVNVSARQLVRDTFVPMVERVLASTAFPPDRLELEVTESALMNDIDAVVERLHVLRGLGVSLAIDDFGRGYSSFMYLNRFPIHRLKIDRFFVSNLHHPVPGSNTDAVVEAIVAMATRLGLDVVAEGVETDAEVHRLVALGCNEAQGWRFARAMPIDELVAWLGQRPRH